MGMENKVDNYLLTNLSMQASPPKREEPPREDDSMEVDESMREFEASSPCEFPSGKMVWARVGGAPFWPSAVVADPDLGRNVVHPRRLCSTKISWNWKLSSFGW